MAYPPSVPSGARINTTPAVDLHPADHVSIHAALTDIINVLGNDPAGDAASLTARLAPGGDTALIQGFADATARDAELTVPVANTIVVLADTVGSIFIYTDEWVELDVPVVVALLTTVAAHTTQLAKLGDRTITVSTSAASGGADGDIHFKV